MPYTIRYARGLVEALVALREQRGLTQAALAKRLDVAASHISRIENGSDARLSTYVEMARALNAEPMLIPKEYASAVRAVLAEASAPDVERPRFE